MIVPHWYRQYNCYAFAPTCLGATAPAGYPLLNKLNWQHETILSTLLLPHFETQMAAIVKKISKPPAVFIVIWVWDTTQKITLKISLQCETN